jgi:hypothetical protein
MECTNPERQNNCCLLIIYPGGLGVDNGSIILRLTESMKTYMHHQYMALVNFSDIFTVESKDALIMKFKDILVLEHEHEHEHEHPKTTWIYLHYYNNSKSQLLHPTVNLKQPELALLNPKPYRVMTIRDFGDFFYKYSLYVCRMTQNTFTYKIRKAKIGSDLTKKFNEYLHEINYIFLLDVKEDDKKRLIRMFVDLKRAQSEIIELQLKTSRHKILMRGSLEPEPEPEPQPQPEIKIEPKIEPGIKTEPEPGNDNNNNSYINTTKLKQYNDGSESNCNFNDDVIKKRKL